MNIGVDACTWSNKRGFGRFTREILRSLTAIDHKNDYWFFVDKETSMGNVFPDGVEVVVVDTDVSPTQAASASGRRSIGDLWAMTRKVRQYDLDLFFFPTHYTYFPILNRTKIIGAFHDMTAKRFPDEIFPNRKLRLFWNLKERLAIWQSHLILTVSEYSKREIMKFYKIPESRVRTTTEGPKSVFKRLPHDEKLTQALHRYQIRPSERFLLYVGGISPHKNLRSLIRTYLELIKAPSFSDIKLVLVGDYQTDSFYSDYPVLHGLVNELHLERKVIFTGYINDKELAYLYNAASLLVFPSLQEGFGLPAIEAMACGTPVAASNAGALPETLGDVGRYFNPYDPVQMLGVIKSVLSDRNMRDEMRRSGLMRVKQFSWDKAARNLVSIFDNFVKE